MNREVVQEKGKWQSQLEKLSKVSPKEMPDELHLTISKGLELDAKLDISKELSDYSVDELTLTRHVFDQKKCVDQTLEFLGNPKVTNRKKRNSEECLENGTEIQTETANFSKDAYVQGRDLYFSAVLPDRIRFDAGTDESTPDNPIERAEENKELAFEKVDVIDQKMQAFFKKVGVKGVLEPEVFSFSKKALQSWADDRYKESMDAGLKEDAKLYDFDFTEQDEYYYLRYRQGHEGIPYYYYGDMDETVTGTYLNIPSVLEVTYGTKGVANLGVNGIFDTKKIEKKVEIQTFSEILQTFIDTYSSNTANSKITVKKIGLSYVPMVTDTDSLEFKATPVWYFLYNLGDTREHKIYNAVTGEILQ